MSQKTKRYLMLLMAIGLVAVAAGGGSGTFASFTAEVANQGNYFQTGTLFLHDTANGVTCTSESATNNKNIGSGDTCQTIFTATLASGTATTYYAVTLKNAGSLNASGISFYSPGGCSAVAATTVNDGTINGNQSGTVTFINVAGLTYGIPSGASITAGAETFTTTAAAGPGATQIQVSSHLITGTLATGTVITYSPTFGAGSLCSGLDVGIVETDNTLVIGGAAGCVFGTPAGSVCTLNSSTTLSSFPTTAGTAAPLTPLATNGGTGNTGTLLSANGTRYFLIAVKPDGSFDNTFQNKKATIDIVWHIDQV